MTNLKELNLANNKIEVLSHLNEIRQLQTLTLSGNRIKEIQGLNLAMLTSLTLDRNRITSITGLRGLKKLEELSLEGNMIEEASMSDVGFLLVNLTDLNLRANKITRVGRLIGYPKL